MDRNERQRKRNIRKIGEALVDLEYPIYLRVTSGKINGKTIDMDLLLDRMYSAYYNGVLSTLEYTFPDGVSVQSTKKFLKWIDDMKKNVEKKMEGDANGQ